MGTFDASPEDNRSNMVVDIGVSTIFGNSMNMIDPIMLEDEGAILSYGSKVASMHCQIATIRFAAMCTP